ncbi:unnamed protein product [Brassica rapa subsp. narinosa]
MLTILLLGVMATAQKGGPIIPETCVENYPDKADKCDLDQCKSDVPKIGKMGKVVALIQANDICNAYALILAVVPDFLST